MDKNKLLSKIRGSLIGGAIGDALGYPVEFMSDKAIKQQYGKNGITRYELNRNGIAEISDDTQMTLFTANGLLFGLTRMAMKSISSDLHCYVLESYKEWLQTQTRFPEDDHFHTCWIRNIAALNSRRAPGNTCLSALHALKSGMRVNNHSKGCGGVMRVAPVGLFCASENNRHANWKPKDVMELGQQCAHITHKHPMGSLPAAFLSYLIYRLCMFEDELTRNDFEAMVKGQCQLLSEICDNTEYVSQLSRLIIDAINFAKGDKTDETNIRSIGEGWTGEQALTIAIYCAMRHLDNFEEAVVAAVNHSGDSDSTGAICGNIMGAIYGYEAILDYFKENLELADVILALADDLAQGCNISEYGSNDSFEQLQWLSRYVYSYPYGFSHLPMMQA
ncbi:ADP-ribosylglycohydrolase family protein [uncultured Bacteroides sp.]|uniref:ADP-ribosylglycohydrolase family protein n=1 Tax=uncultured Bacteroides sp. TaxID=162156 RepID=UPI0025E7AE2A|nr:ADP-ribosylglycohydrolase family protein [uncultured Bacteroides sp.]